MNPSFADLPLEIRQTILAHVFDDLLPNGPSGESQTSYQITCEYKRLRRNTISRVVSVTSTGRCFRQAATQPLEVLQADIRQHRDILQERFDQLVRISAQEGDLEEEAMGTTARMWDEYDELKWANNNVRIITLIVRKLHRGQKAVNS